MTTPDTGPAVPLEDAAEQQLSAGGDEPRDDGLQLPPDAPEADALEQAQAAAPGEHRAPRSTPLEADEADAAEQAVVVPLDEDEGRS